MVRATGGRRRGGHRNDDGGLFGFMSLQFLVRVQHEQIGTRLVTVEWFVRIRLWIQPGGAEVGGRAGGGAGGAASGGCRSAGRRVRRRGREVQPVEYYFHVGGRHPVLEHGAVVEVDGTGTAL